MNDRGVEAHSSTDELLARSRAGDQYAFRDLVERYQEYAFRLAFRLLADEDEARDVTQESFIRVWRHVERFDPRSRFTTWLYRIVTNLAYDRLRASRRRRRVTEAAAEEMALDNGAYEADAAAAHENRLIAARIGELVADLPPRQRVVFTLRDLHGLGVGEVAEILNVAPGTVKANLSYARQKIRERLTATRRQRGAVPARRLGRGTPDEAKAEGAPDEMP